MPIITVIFGALLIALGLTGFYVNGASHPTALIPTWFGLGLILFGLLATKRSIRMHAMHVAVLIALIGAIGAMVTAFKPARQAAAGASASSAAAGAFTASNCKWAMFLLCGLYVLLCIGSFASARGRRRQALAKNGS